MDYKETLNLPRPTFPMKANLSRREPELLQAVGREPAVRADPEGRQGPRAVHPARRPSLRQRPYPHRHRPQQDPQGHHRQARGRWPASMRRYVPGWDCHGLPIEHQVDKKLGAKKKDHDPAEMRQHCRAYARSSSTSSARSSSGWACWATGSNPYLTMTYATRRSSPGSSGSSCRNGGLIRSKKADLLVLHLRDRPGRGRGRVPGRAIAVHLCEVSAVRTTCAGELPGAGRKNGLCRHLDHHPLDPAGQPRDRPAPRFRVRGRRHGGGEVLIVAAGAGRRPA